MKKDLLKTLSRAHLGILRLCLIALSLMVWGNVAWADTTVTFSPTAEYNLRVKSDKQSYETKKSYTDEKEFEVNHGSHYCAIQQYKVTDLSSVKSLTLTLTDGSSSDALAIWAFQGTWASDMSASDFYKQYTSTTGVALGESGTDSYKSDYLLKNEANSKSPSTFTISGTALTTLKSNAASDGTITLLITNRTSEFTVGSHKRTYLSSNSGNVEANRPVLTATYEKPVYLNNGTTSTGYDDLASALSAVTADNSVITIYANQTLSTQQTINNNITVNGNGKTLTYTNTEDATASCFSVSDSKQLTLTNVQFSSSNTGTYDVTIGAKARLILGDANNSFPKGFNLSNAEARVDANNITLDNTNPIKLTIAKNYADAYAAVLQCNNVPVDAFVAQNCMFSLVREKSGSNYELKTQKMNVTNNDQNKGYADLATAISDETTTTGTTLTVNRDVTVLSNRLEVSKELTITGNAGTERILRDTNLDALTLLSKAKVTLKNIIFDGQSVSRSRDAIECATGGDLILDGVTFQNYTYAESGYADVKVTSNDGVLKLKNTNTFQLGVYLNNNKRVYIESSSTFSSTNKLNLYVANDYSENYVCVQNCGDVDKINLMDKTRELYKSSTKDELYIKTKDSYTETRTTATGSYGTICLPLDATVTGAVAMVFTGRTSEGMVFTPISGTKISAGVPYLYRATAASQTFALDKTSTRTAAQTTDKGFAGSYVKKELSAGQYLLSSGVWRFAKASTEDANHTYVYVGAYKCYFPSLPDVGSGSAKAGSVTFGIETDETTGIDYVNLDANTSTSSAQAQGKFFQNGKLVIMKNGKMFNAAGQEVK